MIIFKIILIWLVLAFLFVWYWHRRGRKMIHLRKYGKRRLDQMQLAIDDLNAENDPPERDFAMEREKLEADSEDAEEGRQERARERHEEIIQEMKAMARLEKEEKK
jgi:flagellar biosynthesis/type III secretory pathway M-ring protein FliF/YscJ